MENTIKVKLLDNHEYKGEKYTQGAIIDVEPQHANTLIVRGFAEKFIEAKPEYRPLSTK